MRLSAQEIQEALDEDIQIQIELTRVAGDGYADAADYYNDDLDTEPIDANPLYGDYLDDCDADLDLLDDLQYYRDLCKDPPGSFWLD